MAIGGNPLGLDKPDSAYRAIAEIPNLQTLILSNEWTDPDFFKVLGEKATRLRRVEMYCLDPDVESWEQLLRAPSLELLTITCNASDGSTVYRSYRFVPTDSEEPLLPHEKQVIVNGRRFVLDNSFRTMRM